tara:strand:+ start:6735 stop:7448 length:714 start_codon:yes stop_codon:yes gene_type:complete
MAGLVVAAGIGAGIQIIGGLIAGKKAKEAEAAARVERDRINRALALFESQRQDVINPFTSNAGMIDEMRGELNNPYANLGVATGAAEIQMEQTDIALANTLDTLQATGASAGGATALAQAAARSKKDVAANIEQQEAQNEKLRAQGEEQLQAKEMQLTQMEMAEEARMQQGELIKFNAQERRDEITMDRMSGQEAQARTNMANANAAQQAATAGIISGVGGLVTAGIGSGQLTLPTQ